MLDYTGDKYTHYPHIPALFNLIFGTEATAHSPQGGIRLHR